MTVNANTFNSSNTDSSVDLSKWQVSEKDPAYNDVSKASYCEYCNKRIYRIGFLLKDTVIWKGKGTCTCAESIEARRKKKEQDELLEKQREAYNRKQKTKQLINSSNMTDVMKCFKFDDYKPTTPSQEIAIKKIRWYADHFNHSNKKGFYLHGKPDTGKTHLLLSMANELIKKSISVIYLSNADFKQKLNTFTNKNKAADYKRNFIQCDLLIIDDLGTEKPSEAYITNLINIIEKRTLNNKAIVIASNYDPANLEGRLIYNPTDKTGAEKIIKRIDRNLEMIPIS